MKYKYITFVIICILVLFSFSACGVVNETKPSTEISKPIELVDKIGNTVKSNENSLLPLLIDGVEYKDYISMSDMIYNHWCVYTDEDKANLDLLQENSDGYVQFKLYNLNYVQTNDSGYDYDSNESFFLNVSYGEIYEKGTNNIFAIEILPYDLKTHSIISNVPDIEYNGVKLGDSLEIVIQKMGKEPDSETETLFINRKYKFDNGSIEFIFDREKDVVIGFTYSVL